jgi:carbonic anhydrase
MARDFHHHIKGTTMKPQQESDSATIFENGRRSFLQLAALGGGASLLAVTPLIPEARAAGATDALLLSCMDFRLMDDIERYMSGRKLRDKYDHVVLAGASLGAITDKYPAWNKTFWEHLDIAIKLHNIHTVIVMDHRDCGAYKVILGPEHAKDPKTEKETHATQLKKLKAQIVQKYPKLKVEMLLMALDGKVEVIS